MSGKSPSSTYYEVLALIECHGEAIHGYDLADRHCEEFGARRRIPYGQLYATIKRLERDGFIEVTRSVQDLGPSRVEYSITARGQSTLKEWLNNFNAESPIEVNFRKVITLRISLGQQEALGILDSYVEGLEASVEMENPPTGKGFSDAVELFDQAAKRHLLDWIKDARSTSF